MSAEAAAAPTPADAERPTRPWRRYARDVVLGLGVLALFVLGVGIYYTERFEIRSESMTPTLEVGDNVWAVRLMQPPERGDLVAFTNPRGNETLIKRVIGLPGETIEARDGTVHVNRGELDESIWVANPEATADFDQITLGTSEYFVMGDNRDRSTDSRDFGPIGIDDITYEIVGD